MNQNYDQIQSGNNNTSPMNNMYQQPHHQNNMINNNQNYEQIHHRSNNVSPQNNMNMYHVFFRWDSERVSNLYRHSV